MFNVGPNFDMNVFAEKMAETYRMKGYTVTVANMGNICTLGFDKATGGINMLLGMGEAVKANITQNENTVTISFSDEEWTSKIIALVVGWFLCMIPFITGIVGVVKQINLPKSIGNDAMVIASSL